MSEENKTVELKDEDLEKVAGGFAPEAYSFNCGDTFKMNQNENLISIFLGQNGSLYNMNDEITLTLYNTVIHSKKQIKIEVWNLVSNFSYFGIHTETELDAQYGIN